MWTSRHRTLDEYVDIPFVFTRVFVTCFGGCFLVVIAVSICALVAAWWPKPAPRGVEAESEEAEVRPYADEPRRPPILDYSILLSLSALPIFGMALVWRRPRAGFLMAGAGLALFVAALRLRILLEMGVEDLKGTFGWLQDTVVLSLLSWLAFAWWKVGPPRPHEPFRGPL